MSTPFETTEFMKLFYESDTRTLVLKWLPQTEAMSSDQFKAEILGYAEHAALLEARNLMVDVSDFRHQMAADVGPWRDQYIVPLYNAGGATKFAFVMPGVDPLPPEEPPRDGGPEYSTRYFGSWDDAAQWMKPLHIAVEYTVKDDVDLDEVKALIRGFVADVRSIDIGVHYRSMHRPDSRSFIHVISVDDPDTLKQLQSQEFFKAFGPQLSSRCAEGPTVTRLQLVAQT